MREGGRDSGRGGGGGDGGGGGVRGSSAHLTCPLTTWRLSAARVLRITTTASPQEVTLTGPAAWGGVGGGTGRGE